MRRSLKLILIIFAILAGVLGISAIYLLNEGTDGGETAYGADLEEIRLLAAGEPGDLPVRINTVLVGENIFPRLAVVGGSFDTSPVTMVRVAYQLVFAASTVIVDSGMDRELHQSMQEGMPYFPQAYAKLQVAMRQADSIVITHEHGDHVGGIMTSPYRDEIAPRVLLNREQAATLTTDPQMPELLLSQEDAARFGALDYDKYHALAPGVVLIKAAGHTPGSQMIYVRLKGGDEYILVGDVAWNMENIETVTSRPRVIADFLLGEDTPAVLSQLTWLKSIHDDGDVILVVAHDAVQYRGQVLSGLLTADFELNP